MLEISASAKDKRWISTDLVDDRHLFTKFRIGQSDQCPCQTASMTTEHLLQTCPLHEALRRQIWTVETPVARKLFGSLGDLRRTAIFAQETGVTI